LRRYLRLMTDADVAVLRDARLGEAPLLVVASRPTPAAVETDAEPGSFTIATEAARLTLVGNTPRAVLDAVYALLAQSGCQWSPHGAEEERVPHRSGLHVAVEPLRYTPRFRVRGYIADIMTWHYSQPEYFNSRLQEDRAFIDWMGKSGANAFLFIRHPFDTQLTVPELLPDFERRGVALEYGGHVLPILLPRELFGEHPDYFPQSPEGERTEHGNLCTSHAGALELASRNAVAWVREYPEMRVVHLWGADLWKGGWCRCDACRGVGAQEQSLRVCNAVARALTQAGIARPVCYLAYHDTIDADAGLRPDPDVYVEFAPRERCYGHAIDDAQCTTNRRYAAALERYCDLFDGRVRLFEYYGDAILFCGCAVPLPEVIERDLTYYHGLGVREVTMLQFGTFSLWAYPSNFLAFARATTDGGHCAADVERYCRRFGAHAAHVYGTLGEVERLMRAVVTYGDILRPPRRAEHAAALRARLDDVLPNLAACAQALAAGGDATVGAQGALLCYTHTLLQGVRREVECRLQAEPATEPSARTLYEAALRVIETVDRRYKGLWGAVDLPIIHAIHAMAERGSPFAPGEGDG
jgi:hypothetical protein